MAEVVEENDFSSLDDATPLGGDEVHISQFDEGAQRRVSIISYDTSL